MEMEWKYQKGDRVERRQQRRKKRNQWLFVLDNIFFNWESFSMEKARQSECNYTLEKWLYFYIYIHSHQMHTVLYMTVK